MAFDIKFCVLLAILGLQLCTADRKHLRIVGGDIVTPIGKYPFQGSIHHAFTEDHMCGCVLITQTFALTSAFCIADSEITNYYVYFGIHDQELRQGRPQRYTFNEVIYHPDYVEDEDLGNPNDLALLRMSTPVNILGNEFIDTVQMADIDGPDFVDAECSISGWGYLDGFDPIPPIELHEAKVDVLEQSYCATLWTQINEGQVCVGDSTNQDKGACMDDTGGPLTCNMNGTMVLAGISSWYETNCEPTLPSVYTRISSYRDWIDTSIGL